LCCLDGTALRTKYKLGACPIVGCAAGKKIREETMRYPRYVQIRRQLEGKFLDCRANLLVCALQSTRQACEGTPPRDVAVLGLPMLHAMSAMLEEQAARGP
jgi:hypothetical protein